jgi:DNA-directed RNA polymerase subunit RPC12/RpoP
MKATDLDRYGCTLGGRRIAYDALRYYVCEACGGAITHRVVREDDHTEERVACAACGGEEIISESKYLRQIAEGHEVLQSLPPELRVLIESEREQVTAEQAIEDLFG